MVTRTAFHLDCHGVIPECGFACPKCIEEIHAVVGKMPGVENSHLDEEGKEAKIVVEHDPDVVAVEQLSDALAGLPSFYEGRFVPSVVES